MRATLKLDGDIAILLRQIQRERGLTFKETVNQVLREGLRSIEQHRPDQQPFRTETVSLGRCRLNSLDNIAEALAAAEGEGFR